MSTLEYLKENLVWNARKWILHQCDICKFKTTSTYSKISHAIHHELGSRPFDCETNNVEMYFCTDCDFTTFYITVLKTHVLTYHLGNTVPDSAYRKYTCKNCDFVTHFSLDWCKHVQSEEGKEEQAGMQQFDNNGICWYTCYRCTDNTKYKYLQEHEMQWFQCDNCEYKTKQEDFLNIHMQCHHMKYPVQWFVCEKCGFRTEARDSFRNHMPSADHEIQWFKCDMCEYITKHKYKLQTHTINRHLEEHEVQWFICDKCDYGSKVKDSLKRHILNKHLDSETRCYECDQCEYRTGRKDTLRSHVLYNHLVEDEIRWFVCDKCDYRAKAEASLRKHVLNKHLTDDHKTEH